MALGPPGVPKKRAGLKIKIPNVLRTRRSDLRGSDILNLCADDGMIARDGALAVYTSAGHLLLWRCWKPVVLETLARMSQRLPAARIQQRRNFTQPSERIVGV